MLGAAVDRLTALVALRKESVDRNIELGGIQHGRGPSLSARRAWIEIIIRSAATVIATVALRKESVDRNLLELFGALCVAASLSARRAWIEITKS